MARYRHALPQLGDTLFLTDGGIETTLVFRKGFDLPHFAAFDLLRHGEGRRALGEWYREHAGIARERQLGFVLESATWRASPDWAERIGYTPQGLELANREAIALIEELRDELESERSPMVLSGCVGPRGDGYAPEGLMSEAQAERYHAVQIGTFADTAADMICAITMTHAEEAIGIARAARAHAMPVAISFTVETDGTLPSGQPLADAIHQVDRATGEAPAYYMINCAHPTHFEHVLDAGAPWMRRIRGIRANASRCSHAELDEAEELDIGQPLELGGQYRALRERHDHLSVLGGCCGTDERHVTAIADACGAH